MKKLFLIHIYSFKASLQSCHKKNNPNKRDIRNNPKRINKKSPKRTFSFTSSYYKASMCLEATLSLTFFLFFMVNIFSIISLYRVYTKDLVMLQQQGKTVAAYTYAINANTGKKEDIIKLQNTNLVRPLFPILSIKECRITTQCVVKSWTGYDVEFPLLWSEGEQYVYVTEYGEVYHKSRSCSHLELSIQAINVNSLKEKTNAKQEVYTPCQYCKDHSFVTVVYITSYGNKYHTTTKCQGIKRTIKKIPVSETEGKNACKRCG